MVREALTLERLQAMPVDDAAALFVARRAEGLTAGEQELLAEWLAESAEHQAALACAERGWDAFDAAGDDEILAAMRAHALAPRRHAWPRWIQVAAAAAALLLLATASLVLPALLTRNGVPAVQEIAWTRYEAPATQLRTVKLADGSVMMLDAGSAAETRFTADRRSIRLLRGRALFDVSHDAARPFGVMAATRRVIALGTRFEVDLGDAMLKVTLLRGKVAVEPMGSAAQTVMLAPGQQFAERDGTGMMRSVLDQDPAWIRGLIDLDDVPLGQAVEQINRYSSEHIVIRDGGVAALRVSGQFRAGEAQRFATTAAELLGLRVSRHGNEIELGRK
jgi:transmembrane sensor